MRQIRRGLFRVWIIATVLWELWVVRDLVGEFTHNPPLRGWDLIWAVGLFAILGPLGVLALGRALLWAAEGFRRE